MKHTHTRMWVHLLFGTKYNLPLLIPPAKEEIMSHLNSQLLELGCMPEHSVGMPDHVHLLFICKPTLAVSEVVKQLKGNSSHWINDHDLTRSKFVWEKGYSCFSESEEGIQGVLEMLYNQKEYHETKSFLQEVDELIGQHAGAGGRGADFRAGAGRGVV